ncbi:NAD(P)-binding protein [Calocera viscosa TUFC12733]|uniref:NAD(P)-binding protein n=1 Tax=Calocera viscosa (strain TUFC12733) TaxID=1330018 RepID=A0A167I7T1_CALVF|nr:NAD(P)-binding protein [Calocera viscosa TUFC12733]
MSPTVYLVSGANRGIGLELVTQLAARDNVVVFAGARNPSTAKDLHTLESKYPGKVYTVKLTSPDVTDNKAVVAKIKEIVGRLDVVICNAGIMNSFVPSERVSLDDMRETFEVNVLGPLVLFQATYQLLKASSDSPKFILIASAAGSVEVGTKFPVPFLPYGTTKAAANWLMVKLHYEYPGLVSVPVHPGSVKTDMGTSAREQVPEIADAPMITSEEGVKGVLSVIDSAKRDEVSGPKLMNYDGSILPW